MSAGCHIISSSWHVCNKGIDKTGIVARKTIGMKYNLKEKTEEYKTLEENDIWNTGIESEKIEKLYGVSHKKITIHCLFLSSLSLPRCDPMCDNVIFYLFSMV